MSTVCLLSTWMASSSSSSTLDALVDFVAPAFVLGRDRLARLVIDQLLAQAVPALLVDLAKRDALRRRRGGTERDGARDDRKLEIALPICTRRHGNTPTNCDCA